jgi:outer membrane scaffolding protein for murein synthesis (MipA/OmpV family)
MAREHMRCLTGVIVISLASSASPPAIAQQAEEEAYAGLGLRLRPAYEGAKSSRGQAIPYLRYYGEHLFARTTQGILEGGVRTRPLGKVVFGAQLAYEDGRLSEESAFLESRNFEDIDPGASAGIHAEIDWNVGPAPANALVRYRRNLDSDLGAQADLRLTVGVYDAGRVRAGVYGQLTWSDRKAARSYFGLDAQQSSRTGLPVYDAAGGLRYSQIGVLGATEISGRWLALWGFNLHRVEGDAADSPIVRDRTNWFANAGIARRF